MKTRSTPDATGFAALGLSSDIVKSLVALGYEEPTPIQREAIGPLLEGHDLLGQAATGTGKTAAFSLPILQSIVSAGPARGIIQSLILTPTRELAVQVAEAIYKYGRETKISVLPIYGGADMRQQLRALKRGVDVVVATPGRALDHIKRGSLQLDNVRVVVLDEADEMLDMGFAEDLEAILEATPADRQTALFSATMAPKIRAIANRHLNDPVHVSIAHEVLKAGDLPKVTQRAYVVTRAHKGAALGRVLDMEQPTSTIVFCRTRTEVDELTSSMGARGYRAEALHGGLSQEQRDRVMKRFRAKTTDLLIATDVAARGLDVEHVSHVVNYDVPTSPDAYVHRIGRTGRAGREGVAITLVEPREHHHLRNIERVTKRKISIETIPTVADLNARRMELTAASVRETLIAGEFRGFRSIVDSLADGEFDIVDIAAAAIKTAHEALGNSDEQDQEIPEYQIQDRGGRGREKKAKGKGKKSKSFGDGREGLEFRPKLKGQKSSRKKTTWDVVRLYIGAGRKAKIRPGDLVGAIANEAGVDSRDLGAIEIYDKHSLIEVPVEAAEDIVRALRQSTVKGRKVPVRLDQR